jgi:23S rRNA U2552 (ribose-2'-O)-methylase RlmE/FtsJ
MPGVWYVDFQERELHKEYETNMSVQDLCAAALQFAHDTLRVGGHFVCKFYQGAEDKDFEKQLKKMFRTVHREKPESSRSVGWPMRSGKGDQN